MKQEDVGSIFISFVLSLPGLGSRRPSPCNDITKHPKMSEGIQNRSTFSGQLDSCVVFQLPSPYPESPLSIKCVSAAPKG